MDNLNENSFSFPNPPKHYKKFINNENDMKEPEIENLQKLNEFITFGNKYSLREINYNNLLFDEHPTNFFISGNNIQPYTNSNKYDNLCEELVDELYLLKKTFKELLNKIAEDVEKTLDYVNLVVNNLQRINIIIQKLKNKQILIQTRQYFEDEIKRNCQLEEQLNVNTKVVEDILNKISLDF